MRNSLRDTALWRVSSTPYKFSLLALSNTDDHVYNWLKFVIGAPILLNREDRIITRLIALLSGTQESS